MLADNNVTNRGQTETRLSQSKELVKHINSTEYHIGVSFLIGKIKAGADVNYQDECGNTPLLHALESQKEHLAEYMIRVAKADLHLRNHQGISAAETILPSSPLYPLVADSDRAISDPKKLSECLCKRVQEHHVNSFHILMLLRQGADINFKDQTQSNLTPLMLAVIARNDTMVDYLLDQPQ